MAALHAEVLIAPVERVCNDAGKIVYTWLRRHTGARGSVTWVLPAHLVIILSQYQDADLIEKVCK